jgi:quinol monooxygenase YgiN
MHAVVGIWRRAGGQDEARMRVLRERIVPSVRRNPGFVAGYWTHDHATGKDHTFVVFETREDAETFKAVVERNSRDQAEHGMRKELLAIAEVTAEARATLGRGMVEETGGDPPI